MHKDNDRGTQCYGNGQEKRGMPRFDMFRKEGILQFNKDEARRNPDNPALEQEEEKA